jgi:hypothetical protein
MPENHPSSHASLLQQKQRLKSSALKSRSHEVSRETARKTPKSAKNDICGVGEVNRYKRKTPRNKAFSGAIVFGAGSCGLLAWRDAGDSNSWYRFSTTCLDARVAFGSIADHQQCRHHLRTGPPPLSIHLVVTPENESCASRPDRCLPPRGWRLRYVLPRATQIRKPGATSPSPAEPSPFKRKRQHRDLASASRQNGHERACDTLGS